MEIQGSTGVSDASAELRAAKLAKNQQEQEGKAALQLLDSAAGVPQSSSANPALGSTVDTYA
ncbi:hypothetical protein [Bowmanella sp. JS7-9]|uniref:Motility protein n=1 Tax=Pseudobowmanella zhangzhouensis TaxID=1537679 RepID=A0ABW1XPG7_9ALTE|nr:hypothetical protein [Bowmanella sp. JS7-9]TBX23820.1 hypothetical protein TK45_07005 [Bowmanella sp. JS7-9]